jgi:Fe-S-cluster containining protein
MKYIDPNNIDQLPGRQIHEGDTFRFRCHSGIDCFNQCCRNLNLFLYPYDVLRLKRGLDMSSDMFIETYVHVVMRPGHYFPEVLLRMEDHKDGACPFVEANGCRIYTDRPHTCRNFPMEQGAIYDVGAGATTPVFFFRPPDFCKGPEENQVLTLADYARDQEADVYNQMTLRWAYLRRLFQDDPWGPEGFESPRGKMAFMAAYNIDRFSEFVFNSSFIKRYRIKPKRVKQLRASETALLKFAFEWIEFFVWGRPSKHIRPR